MQSPKHVRSISTSAAAYTAIRPIRSFAYPCTASCGLIKLVAHSFFHRSYSNNSPTFNCPGHVKNFSYTQSRARNFYQYFTISHVSMLVSPVLLILLVQFEIRGCAAVNDSNTIVEDLSQFPRGPETCPDLIAWPQVPVPISCDDPGCRGISWAVPPYRCRQQG